ncbi:hypothetical protein LCGC14_1321950 [marine sediment metagenome]|uniref:Uncharacterized protein n=1 Tax=marine sediment metagenome TaxID=412755 RepID=A0A0F9N002_9ZZZZ
MKKIIWVQDDQYCSYCGSPYVQDVNNINQSNTMLCNCKNKECNGYTIAQETEIEV